MSGHAHLGGVQEGLGRSLTYYPACPGSGEQRVLQGLLVPEPYIFRSWCITTSRGVGGLEVGGSPLSPLPKKD